MKCLACLQTQIVCDVGANSVCTFVDPFWILVNALRSAVMHLHYPLCTCMALSIHWQLVCFSCNLLVVTPLPRCAWLTVLQFCNLLAEAICTSAVLHCCLAYYSGVAVLGSCGWYAGGRSWHNLVQ